jgi:hypothetical protein
MRKLAFVTGLVILMHYGLPESALAYTCTHTCSSGAVISCQASTSCNSGVDWIQCNGGARQYCPTPCTVGCTFGLNAGQTCTSVYGVCSSGFGWVSCDGVTLECPPCPNPWEIECTSW